MNDSEISATINNLKEAYPQDIFIAFPLRADVSEFAGKRILDAASTGWRILRLDRSFATGAITNDSLQSLVENAVMESRNMIPTKRNQFIYEMILGMLPNYHVLIVTGLRSLATHRRPITSGPGKGQAYFDSRDFGTTSVFVYLY